MSKVDDSTKLVVIIRGNSADYSIPLERSIYIIEINLHDSNIKSTPHIINNIYLPRKIYPVRHLLVVCHHSKSSKFLISLRYLFFPNACFRNVNQLFMP